MEKLCYNLTFSYHHDVPNQRPNATKRLYPGQEPHASQNGSWPNFSSVEQGFALFIDAVQNDCFHYTGPMSSLPPTPNIDQEYPNSQVLTELTCATQNTVDITLQ